MVAVALVAPVVEVVVTSVDLVVAVVVLAVVCPKM